MYFLTPFDSRIQIKMNAADICGAGVSVLSLTTCHQMFDRHQSLPSMWNSGGDGLSTNYHIFASKDGILNNVKMVSISKLWYSFIDLSTFIFQYFDLLIVEQYDLGVFLHSYRIFILYVGPYNVSSTVCMLCINYWYLISTVYQHPTAISAIFDNCDNYNFSNQNVI